MVAVFVSFVAAVPFHSSQMIVNGDEDGSSVSVDSMANSVEQSRLLFGDPIQYGGTWMKVHTLGKLEFKKINKKIHALGRIGV